MKAYKVTPTNCLFFNGGLLCSISQDELSEAAVAGAEIKFKTPLTPANYNRLVQRSEKGTIVAFVNKAAWAGFENFD